MSTVYKSIINHLREGNIDQRELNSLEDGLERLFKRIEDLENESYKNNEQKEEMRTHIDCLKAELAEVQMKKQESAAKSFEIKIDSLEIPIQKASVLIRDTQDKYQEVYGMNDGFSMAISDLKQIAGYLLVYCKYAEVE